MIDGETLLTNLKLEHAALGQAITVLQQRILNQQDPAPQAPKKSHHKQASGTSAKKKRRSLTQEERAALSAKLKKVWAKRKAAAKKG